MATGITVRVFTTKAGKFCMKCRQRAEGEGEREAAASGALGVYRLTEHRLALTFLPPLSLLFSGALADSNIQLLPGL